MNCITTKFRSYGCSSPLRFSLLKASHILVLVLMVGAGQVGFGQTQNPGKMKITTRITNESCKNVNPQDGYVVRSSHIEHPFDFLPWVRLKMRRAEAEIQALINGKPYLSANVVDKAWEIIEKENFLPDTSDLRLQIDVEIVSIENCSKPDIDVVYQVYSTQILPVLSATPEARVTEREAPQTASGMSNVKAPAAKPIHLTPMAGYDDENKLFAGGRLEINSKSLWKVPFDSIVVEGKGSSEMRYITAALSGSADPSTWLSHIEWALNYNNYSLPTGTGNISGGHLSANVSGTTKPFADGRLIARFGGLLEGGNRQSDITNTQIASNTLSNTAFGALKLYTGLSSRFTHNVISASYGLELGAVGNAARVDWRKHIGDVTHEFWYPLGDHRILDLESRFTVGGIQVPGRISLSERFFGGNNEELFIPGESWHIRENPVIRAIPGNRFFRTVDGAGGDSFLSYNLTAAYAVWRHPVVPSDLTSSAGFDEAVELAFEKPISNLKKVYLVKDQHYIALTKEMLPKVPAALDNLKAAIQSAQTARPELPAAQFTSCIRVINTAARRTKTAIEEVKNYVSVPPLLSVSADEGENQLGKVMDCATALNESVHDPAIAAASSNLHSIRKDMEAEFQKIDQNKAQLLATKDLAIPRRMLNTIFKDMNIYSVSPVFVFDVANIGSRQSGIGDTRYGPGAGLRFELASMVHFTAGYAWNIRRGPGEGSGTVFFSMGFRDLFR